MSDFQNYVKGRDLYTINAPRSAAQTMCTAQYCFNEKQEYGSYQPGTYAQVFTVKAPLLTSSGLFVCLPLAFTYSVEPEPIALSNENN